MELKRQHTHGRRARGRTLGAAVLAALGLASLSPVQQGAVLTAAGGKPDLGRVEDHCRARPEFYDCRLMAAHPSLAAASWPQSSSRFG